MANGSKQQDLWPHSLMWYSAPASKYIEGGLPIGNGMLAAMIVAGAAADRVALNHEWLWRGKGRTRDTEECWQHLARIRELFFAGKVLEAGQLANEKLGGPGGKLAEQGIRNRVDPYQPAGDLFIETDHADVQDYRRELDLDRALVTVSYRRGGDQFTRQYFAHAALPVVVARLKGQGKAKFKAKLTLGRIDDPECRTVNFTDDGVLGLAGRFEEGIQFAVEARVYTDGTATPNPDGRSLTVEGGQATVVLSVAVNLDGQDALPLCRQQIASAQKDWQSLLSCHVAAHRDQYRRVKVQIGQDRRDVPTSQRLADLRAGKPDEGLLALYVNFGRYLLIAGSQPGGLPTNLQGKWNEELNPPWECDLHEDVNIQMNYWPAEPCGLGDNVSPLFDHMERFLPHARQMARKLYNCRGIFMPIQTDPWGRATPESRGWDVWTGAAAWLAQHLWLRYEYSLDANFLRDRAYPYFKEVAAFYEDYLVRHPAKNWLVTVPSQSPENYFVGGTTPVSLCVASTMDLELIRDVLGHAIAAGEILGLDADLRAKWRDILKDLAPFQVGRHGQLQEWLEDYEEAEPGHRHFSHLLALYPGDLFTVEDEPQWARAARVSLECRLAASGGHTGWSRSWVVCLWARLREGDAAHEHLKHLVCDFATEALLDLHPPRIFQIDGNFGGAAGFCEMILQSHRGLIRVLPALPAAWKEGRVEGLRARGGFAVDVAWVGGKATEISVHSLLGQPCRVHYAGGLSAVTCDGKAVEFKKLAADRIEFQTQAGKTYRIK